MGTLDGKIISSILITLKFTTRWEIMKSCLKQFVGINRREDVVNALDFYL